MENGCKKNADGLKGKKLFLFDMDGTIYLGENLFEGVRELLQAIENKGGRYVFITNNASHSVEDYVKKVRRIGLEFVGEENFFTSTQAAMMLLKEKHDGEKIYVQGTKSFVAELKKNGFDITEEYADDAQVILIGFDPEFTGEKVRVTCEMLTKHDLPYYATNPDWVCPVEFGYIPDCGSMCQSFERATGKTPQFIGKPQPTMINAVLEKFGYTKEETVVIGDRLYTDIASGVNAGVDTVFVLSGEGTLADLEKSEVKPTYILNHVKEIAL